MMTAKDEETHQGGERAQVSLGIRFDTEDGVNKAFLAIGDAAVLFDADTADDLSAAIRNLAVELRNGGRLQ